MTANGWMQIASFCAVLLVVTKPLGLYLVKVYDGSMQWLRPIERAMYQLAGVDADEDQHWTRYATALLLFSLVSLG
jgi:K+-transporting ATPase ATPase A chain